MMTKSNSRLEGKQIIMLLDNPCDPDLRVEKEAQSLLKAGAQVSILAWGRKFGAEETFRKHGFRIFRLPPKTQPKLGWRQFFFLWQFYREAISLIHKKALKADIIYAHDVLMLPLGVFLSRKLNAKLVYDAHEIYRWMEAGRLPFLWLKAVEFIEQLLTNRYVDLFITVSEQRVEKYWKSKLRRTPVVVGNWYNEAVRDKGMVRTKLGIPSEYSKVISYAGALNKNRQIELLIGLAENSPDIFVLIAGRGDQEIEKKLISSDEALQNLKYLGWVSNPQDVLSAGDSIYYVFDKEHPYSNFLAPNALFLAIALQRWLVTSGGGEVDWIKDEGVVKLPQPTLKALEHSVRSIPETLPWSKVREEYRWTVSESKLIGAVCEILDKET